MDEKILVQQHGLQSSFKGVIMTEQQYLLPHMPSLAMLQIDSRSFNPPLPNHSSLADLRLPFLQALPITEADFSLHSFLSKSQDTYTCIRNQKCLMILCCYKPPSSKHPAGTVCLLNKPSAVLKSNFCCKHFRREPSHFVSL